MDPNGYLRTIQLGFAVGHAVILELYDETGKPLVEDMEGMFRVLTSILEDPRVRLVGHHLRSDGEWLLGRHGIDVRLRTAYDTMVLEHLINSTGPFGLEALTTKYTDMGRYDLEVLTWVEKHKKECAHGYGKVPAAILLPYGAKDVDAPRRILEKMRPAIDERYSAPRGEFPSLEAIDMHTSVFLYELEMSGMLVDKPRLTSIIEMYQKKRDDMEGRLITMASTLGLPEFNFRSNPQRQKLLFEILDLTPIESTDGIPWARAVDRPAKAARTVSPEPARRRCPSWRTCRACIRLCPCCVT
jgi:DNA polymerase I-like protein with 3'-5' exonuclease and polymerase domains